MLGGELNEASFDEWLNAAQGGDETRRHVNMLFGGQDSADAPAAAQSSDESTIIGSPQKESEAMVSVSTMKKAMDEVVGAMNQLRTDVP